MKTIHKYPVPIQDEIPLPLPINALILCVQLQNGQPHIWAEVDTDESTRACGFFWRGTGHELTGDEGKYVGTVQIQSLVFHLFVDKGVDVGFRTRH